MNKSTIIAGLGGFVVLFILNYLFYGMSGLMDGYATEAGEAVSKGEDMSMPLLIAGHLISCLVLSFVYSKWARGSHSFGHGFQLGALIGVLLGFGLGLIWLATSSFMSSTGHIVDAIWQIVSYGITCGVISVIYGMTDKE
ncbi:MAG: hypothetical protein KJO50_00020 [Bacteroidia bacterium]|nr:hypothetical protein [Bacteroidia bacterium]